MKASALNDFVGNSEIEDHDQIVGPELGGDPGTACASLSDVRTLMLSSCFICPYCKCLRIVIDGQIIYYDYRKKEICSHNCRHN